MKLSNLLSALILIASASFLTGVQYVRAESPSPNQLLTAEPRNPDSSAQKVKAEQQTGESGRTAKPPTHDTFWAEWVMAVATTVYSFFAILQWRALKKTVDETQGLVISANRQAKAAEAQVTNLEKTLGATEEAAGTARESADTARKALLLQFRPKLIVRNVVTKPIEVIRGEKSAPFLGNYPVNGQLYISNIGDSDAHITEVGCWVEWFEVTLPMHRPYETQPGNTHPFARDLKPGQSTPCLFDGRPLDEKLAYLIRYGQSEWRLYIMGWVEYTDDLGIGRRTTFCRVWNAGFQRFMTVDNADYEHVG